MTDSDLQINYVSLSKLEEEVSNCADTVRATSGEDEVGSPSLSGADPPEASTAADAVVSARTTFAGRLTSHSEGVYDATRRIRSADDWSAGGPAGPGGVRGRQS